MTKAILKPSPVHGQGVFATKDIEPEEIICFYDGYVKDRTLVTPEENVYAYGTSDPTKYLIGYHPHKNENGIAQYINDHNYFQLHLNMSIAEMFRTALQYDMLSKEFMNVTIDENNNAVAIKKIKQGEELFFSYGAGYWFSMYGHQLWAIFGSKIQTYKNDPNPRNPKLDKVIELFKRIQFLRELFENFWEETKHQVTPVNNMIPWDFFFFILAGKIAITNATLYIQVIDSKFHIVSNIRRVENPSECNKLISDMYNALRGSIAEECQKRHKQVWSKEIAAPILFSKYWE